MKKLKKIKILNLNLINKKIIQKLRRLSNQIKEKNKKYIKEKN